MESVSGTGRNAGQQAQRTVQLLWETEGCRGWEMKWKDLKNNNKNKFVLKNCSVRFFFTLFVLQIVTSKLDKIIVLCNYFDQANLSPVWVVSGDLVMPPCLAQSPK